MQAFAAVPQRRASPRSAAGNEMQLQIAEDGVGTDPPAPAEDPADRAGKPGSPLDRRAEPGGQAGADFLYPGMEELGRLHDLPSRIEAQFGLDARAPRQARLEIGDPDRVVIGHGARELARGLAGQLEAAHGPAMGGVQIRDRAQAVEILGAIGGILIVDDMAQTRIDQPLRLRRELAPHPIEQRIEDADAGALGQVGHHLARSQGRRRRAAQHLVEAGIEGLQARSHADAARADRVGEGFATDRQRARRCDRTEQRGRDRAARAFGDAREIRDDAAPRGDTQGFEHAGRIRGAVARLLLFGDGIGPLARRDERRAVGRHQPAQDRASGLHPFRGDDQVDVAGNRHQRQDRRPSAVAAANDLDVVDRRSRALRDARNRGGLGNEAARLGRRRDPARQHPAALSAHRHDGDRDRSAFALRLRRRVHLRFRSGRRRAGDRGGARATRSRHPAAG